MKSSKNSSLVMFHLKIALNVLWVTIYSIPSLFMALVYTFISRPKKDVTGEIVLVTGSGQGLGREICLKFAQLGSELICVDVIAESNQETVKMIREAGGKARGYVCDVSDRKAIMKLKDEVGRVDILINNAGVYPVKGLWNATEAELRTIIDINLMSQFWTVQAFLPGMKQRDHGHIVSISSIAGLTGLAYLEPYCVSKAGLTALMQALYLELRFEGRTNIKLTTCYPYFIKTREDLIECCETSIPMLEKEEAVKMIINGIREELVTFTVPREFNASLNLTRIYPQTYSDKFFDTFFIRVREPKKDLFRELMEDGTLNSNSGDMKSQG